MLQRSQHPNITTNLSPKLIHLPHPFSYCSFFSSSLLASFVPDFIPGYVPDSSLQHIITTTTRYTTSKTTFHTSRAPVEPEHSQPPKMTRSGPIPWLYLRMYLLMSFAKVLHRSLDVSFHYALSPVNRPRQHHAADGTCFGVQGFPGSFSKVRL